MMKVVIFKVRIREGKQQDYLDYAAQLATELEHIDGFIAIDRFVHLQHSDQLVSLSFWRDDEAILAWKQQAAHQAAQAAGKAHIFEHYEIFVAAIERQYDFTRERYA